jgi:5-(carboxyamino)imidazole ribonucleotide mutase
MPRGIPVATVAIGGADNAALLAAQILALSDDHVARRLAQFRAAQTQTVIDQQDDGRLSPPFLSAGSAKSAKL